MSRTARLPARFPVGTKYVLERRGPFVRRYVEFPDGRKVQLEFRKAQACTCAAFRGISIVPEANPRKDMLPRRKARALRALPSPHAQVDDGLQTT